jgi:hypothetical protein
VTIRSKAAVVLFSAAALSARDLTVTQDAAPLLGRCGEAESVLAALPEGARVRLRYSLAGADSRCYAVAAEVGGETLQGYIERDALAGLDAVERERREASAIQLVRGAMESIRVDAPTKEAGARPASGDAIPQALAALQAGRAAEVGALLAQASPDDRDAAILRAQAYLRMTRPADAQAALAPALRREPGDPALLGLAGMAAYQQDRLPEAALYFKQSLGAEYNPSLDKLARAVERERAAGQGDGQAFGSRFVLRYEGDALPDQAARALAGEFEGVVNNLTSRLGCTLSERLVIVVRTLDGYRSATGSADWSGGRYDGRIHVAVPPGGALDDTVRETLAHEFVHACLARRGEWPTWLHEGLAQYLSGRRLAATDRAALASLNAANRLPELAQLGGSWARLTTAEARVAYALSLAAATILHQDVRDHGVRNLLAAPAQLPRLAVKLDGRLRDSLR